MTSLNQPELLLLGWEEAVVSEDGGGVTGFDSPVGASELHEERSNAVMSRKSLKNPEFTGPLQGYLKWLIKYQLNCQSIVDQRADQWSPKWGGSRERALASCFL